MTNNPHNEHEAATADLRRAERALQRAREARSGALGFAEQLRAPAAVAFWSDEVERVRATVARLAPEDVVLDLVDHEADEVG